MQKRLRQLFEKIFALEPGGAAAQALCLSLSFILIIFFFKYMPGRYWSDSEIWGVRVGSLCFSSWQQYACGLKPFYNGLLGVLDWFWPGESMAHLMLSARIATTFFWILSFGIAIQGGVDPRLLLCFLGSSLFFLDASVARSDIWSLPFLLAHISLLINFDVESDDLKSSRAKRKILLIFASAAAAVMMTPKAAITVFSFFPIWVPIVRNIFKQKIFFKKTWLTMVFPAYVVSFGSVAFMLFIMVFSMVFVLDWTEAGLFFLRLFHESEYGASFLSAARFSFISRTMNENPHFIILIVVWLVCISVKFFRGQQRHINQRDACALLLVATFFLFPDKLPYWIATQVFIFMSLISRTIQESQAARRVVFGISIFAFVNGCYWLPTLRNATSRTQARLSMAIEEKTKGNSGAKIYDGLGVVATKAYPSLFLGPGQAEMNLMNVRKIQDEKYDVLVISNKLKGFLFLLATDVAENYIEASPDLYLRTREVLITNPTSPVEEIGSKAFANQAAAGNSLNRLAFLKFDTNERWTWIGNYSKAELGSLPVLCAGCSALRLRITPFTDFFAAPLVGAFSIEFAFEPIWARRTLLESIFSRK